MAENMDFETYKKRIWDGEPSPEYAYFCWRWDATYPPRELGLQKTDPLKREKFIQYIFDSFVANVDTYQLQLEMAYDGKLGYSQSLAFQLWDTYGHTPTELGHMWKWAVSSKALPSSHGFTLHCGRPACVSRNIHCQPIAEAMEVDRSKLGGCNAVVTESSKELDPSLVAFNMKLWQDSQRQEGSGYLLDFDWEHGSGCSRLLQSLRSFLRTIYDKLVSQIVSHSLEFLQVQKAPDVSFLFTENYASRAKQQPREELDSNQPLIFAVAGSGKTQSIFNHLAKTWGHYLVSGHVSESCGHEDSALVNRSGASADTLSLCQSIANLKLKLNADLLRLVNYYSDAIKVLLANRQRLMVEWIEQTKSLHELSGPVYWHLFQTTCTILHDPFLHTFQLRMLFSSPSGPDIASHPDQKQPLRIILDEAQNEIDPFWGEQPPLQAFLIAVSDWASSFSISGTSLRLRECQEVVRTTGSRSIPRSDVRKEIDVLLETLRDLMDEESSNKFAFELADRILDNHGFDPERSTWTDIIQSGALTGVFGDFYFAKALERVTKEENKHKQALLKKWKDLVISSLDRYYSERFSTTVTEHFSKEMSFTRSALQSSLWEYQYLEWGFDKFERPWTRGYAPDFVYSSNLGRVLRTEYAARTLNKKMNEFPLIHSSNRFRELLEAHIERIFKRVAYFSTIDEKMFMEKEIWRIAYPKAEVFQVIHKIDGSEDLFMRAKAVMNGCTHPISAAKVAAFFWDKHSGVQTDNRTESPILCHTTRHSTRFYGRIRWSILYIEHVLALFLSQLPMPGREDSKPVFDTAAKPTNRFEDTMQESLDWLNGLSIGDSRSGLSDASSELDSSSEDTIDCESQPTEANQSPDDQRKLSLRDVIQKAANITAEYIIEYLKQRIARLKHEGHHLLLKDLYATAVRADLMHKPCIFPDDKSARMVTEGFAVLQSVTDTKQELAEPLVLDAVIEYLRMNEGESRYERVLENLLFDVQDNASSYGFGTELFVAWVCTTLLARVVLMKMQSIGGLFYRPQSGPRFSVDTRNVLLEKLSLEDSIGCDGALGKATTLPSIELLNEYDLLSFAGPRMDADQGYGDELKFDQWLRLVRIYDPDKASNEFFPTFYFPSVFAGPDIVFCLTRGTGKGKLVCAIQVKSGLRCPNTKSFELLRTLDPNLWFQTTPDLRASLQQELQQWSSCDKILTLLFVTSTTCSDFFTDRADLAFRLRHIQPKIRCWEQISVSFPILKALVKKVCGWKNRKLHHDKAEHERMTMQRHVRYIQKARGQAFLDDNDNSVKLLTAAKSILQKREYKSSTWAEGENQGHAAKNVQKLTLLERALAEIKDAAQGKNNELDEGPRRKKVKLNYSRGTTEPSSTLNNVEMIDKDAVMAGPTLTLSAVTSEERDFSRCGPRTCSVWPHGYHFAVLDSGDLQEILGHRFQQLSRAMKGIESRREENQLGASLE
ncbi:hypothetical protein MMC07_007062 [Pseudocyphellaria aurata]|nr:hypothetical protein [Pseudocyphellaria aurata]